MAVVAPEAVERQAALPAVPPGRAAERGESFCSHLWLALQSAMAGRTRASSPSAIAARMMAGSRCRLRCGWDRVAERCVGLGALRRRRSPRGVDDDGWVALSHVAGITSPLLLTWPLWLGAHRGWATLCVVVAGNAGNDARSRSRSLAAAHAQAFPDEPDLVRALLGPPISYDVWRNWHMARLGDSIVPGVALEYRRSLVRALHRCELCACSVRVVVRLGRSRLASRPPRLASRRRTAEHLRPNCIAVMRARAVVGRRTCWRRCPAARGSVQVRDKPLLDHHQLGSCASTAPSSQLGAGLLCSQRVVSACVRERRWGGHGRPEPGRGAGHAARAGPRPGAPLR